MVDIILREAALHTAGRGEFLPGREMLAGVAVLEGNLNRKVAEGKAVKTRCPAPHLVLMMMTTVLMMMMMMVMMMMIMKEQENKREREE